MNNLINYSRKKISNYCFSVCGALCCKKGYIILDDEARVDLVVGERRKEFLKNKKLVKMESGQYSLYIGGGCPSLDSNNKCRVHKNSKYPRLCSEFPLFVFGKSIITGPYCPAVLKGELDEEFSQLKKEGYKII